MVTSGNGLSSPEAIGGFWAEADLQRLILAVGLKNKAWSGGSGEAPCPWGLETSHFIVFLLNEI